MALDIVTYLHDVLTMATYSDDAPPLSMKWGHILMADLATNTR